MVNYTFDTSFLVKGLVCPRRVKKDSIYEQQMRIHQKAKDYLARVERQEVGMLIPSFALLETAAVVARVTNNPEDARKAVEFLRQNASDIYYDVEVLEEAIDTAIKVKASGFDILFLTIARITQTELLTDDRQMYEKAKKHKIKTSFLREMS